MLDTNVLVSAILSPRGSPAGVLEAWQQGLFELVVSADILAELRIMLNRPQILVRTGWDAEESADFLALLTASAGFAEPSERLHLVEDEAANRVIEPAIAGDADHLVTGDKKLLDLGRVEECEVVTPARFLAIISAS